MADNATFVGVNFRDYSIQKKQGYILEEGEVAWSTRSHSSLHDDADTHQ